MRGINITGGFTAFVDDEDFDRVVSLSPWRYLNGYAASGVNSLWMHHIVMNEKAMFDHKDGNGLNNQKSNLRRCGQSLNQANRKLNCNNQTGYKGVSYQKSARKYAACIMVNRKRIHLGIYKSPVAAAIAYDDAARTYFGEFATLNFPNDNERRAKS